MSNQTGNSRLICAPGLPFGLPKGYSPSEFLYGEDGPWPSQPTDGNACKVAPEVQDGGQHERGNTHAANPRGENHTGRIVKGIRPVHKPTALHAPAPHRAGRRTGRAMARRGAVALNSAQRAAAVTSACAITRATDAEALWFNLY